jgi:hypothetical protein
VFSVRENKCEEVAKLQLQERKGKDNNCDGKVRRYLEICSASYSKKKSLYNEPKTLNYLLISMNCAAKF